MKMNDNELVIFTPGFRSQSTTKDYYSIDNMVIAGLLGSGRASLVNAIVRSMLESNKVDKFSYVYINGYSNNMSPFGNLNRISPYNELMSELDVENYIESVDRLITKLCMVPFVSNCYALDTVDGVIVIVIDNYSKLPDITKSVIENFIKKSNKSCIKFILCDEYANSFSEILPYINYRVATRLLADESSILLNCDLACSCADEFGSCWFFDKRRPDVYVKYIVDFVAEPILNKLLKTYSYKRKSNIKPVLVYTQLLSPMCSEDCRRLLKEYLNVSYSN